MKIIEEGKARNESFRAHTSQLKLKEKDLIAQVALYAEKFEEFQDALTRSDEMFVHFQERVQVRSFSK